MQRIPKARNTDLGDPTEIGKRPELICNGELQTLARWPNEGFLESGYRERENKTAPTYINEHGTREGFLSILKSGKHVGVRRTMRGWEVTGIGTGVMSIRKWTKLTPKNVSLSEPYQPLRVWDSFMYFGLNLFSEIDRPNEWYLDRTNGLIYWFPPGDIDPNQASVTLTEFSAPFMVEMDNCSNVVLEGLTFQEGRGSAILIDGGENCLLKSCRIMHFGKDGIHVMNGQNHGVSGCFLQYFGHRGIDMKGVTARP